MDRRAFLRRAALLSALPTSGVRAQGFMPPGFPVPGPPGWQISVNLPQMAASGFVQLCPEWCWATSISMIFSFHGHPVDQRRIVAETYGNVVCVPAGSSSTIGQDLSRPWVDDNGRPFNSQVIAAYDAFNGINAIDNQIIINELKNNRPLLYCNTHHAMVVCSLQVGATPFGPQVTSVGVVDPWPYNPRMHPLTALESIPAAVPGGQMTLLAAVRIT